SAMLFSRRRTPRTTKAIEQIIIISRNSMSGHIEVPARNTIGSPLPLPVSRLARDGQYQQRKTPTARKMPATRSGCSRGGFSVRDASPIKHARIRRDSKSPRPSMTLPTANAQATNAPNWVDGEGSTGNSGGGGGAMLLVQLRRSFKQLSLPADGG